MIKAKKFLRDLLDPKKTPKVPKTIRKQAYWCLRHYPAKYEIRELALNSPDIIEYNKAYEDEEE